MKFAPGVFGTLDLWKSEENMTWNCNTNLKKTVLINIYCQKDSEAWTFLIIKILKFELKFELFF